MLLRQEATFSSRHVPHGVALRFRAASLFLASLLLVFAFQAHAFAQDDETDEVVRVRTDLVTVPVFVTDSRGRRVSGLLEKDFVVLDDGERVKTDYFASGAERVALVFALDASGSVRDVVERQRETALALFSRFGRGSRVAVLRFTEKPELVAALTSQPEEALAAFRFPVIAGRRTAIFDAALEAVRAFQTSGPAERRIVILISDGLDTTSRTTHAQVITEARARNVSFYLIHLPLYAPRDGRLVVRPPARGFRDLAEKTGGRYFMLGDAKSALADPRAEYNLAPVFQAIEEDLKGQYVLGYYPAETARDGRPHRIEVRVASTDAKKLRVETLRKDYVLPKMP